jgi:hypothetical protein
MWDLHTPKHDASESCKAIAYTKKKIMSRICNLVQHLLSGLCIIILNVLEEDAMTLCIINIYHNVPTRGHGLAPLFSHDADELTPTLFVGDFNTHSLLWSLPHSTTSSWARDFEEWMGHTGLSILNPLDIPTWFGSKPTDHLSILDLALGNEASILAGQLSPIEISQAESLASDHAMLIFQIYDITDLALAPPPMLSGYRADDEHKASWMKEFTRLMPYMPPDLMDLTVDTQLRAFDTTINGACKSTLQPYQPPRPQGAL